MHRQIALQHCLGPVGFPGIEVLPVEAHHERVLSDHEDKGTRFLGFEQSLHNRIRAILHALTLDTGETVEGLEQLESKCHLMTVTDDADFKGAAPLFSLKDHAQVVFIRRCEAGELEACRSVAARLRDQGPSSQLP